MRRIPFVLASVGCWLVIGAATARGQQPGPYNPYIRRPPVSPYINLLRPGNQALIYHGLIRPQVETFRYQEAQEQALRRLQGDVRSLQQPQLGVTGHQSYFLNYSHFYPLQSPRNRGGFRRGIR